MENMQRAETVSRKFRHMGLKVKRKDQFNREITEERTQKYTISARQMLKIITKMLKTDKDSSPFTSLNVCREVEEV